MTRYNLSKLVDRRRGTSATLPLIEESAGNKVAYLKALRTILRGLAKETRETVVPAAEREIARNRAETRATLDIGEEQFSPLETLAARLVAVANGMMRRVLQLEARRHSATFMQTARRALGVDLAAVVREEDLEGLLESAAARNAGLIKSLSDDVVKRVQTTVTTAVLQGKSSKALRKELAEQFGIADRRAQLIARDQMSKLNSDLNRFRHQQAGIARYSWSTSRDERVRPRHRRIDGNVYEYGKPTGAENGLPPGQPVNCRCTARAIVEF